MTAQIFRLRTFQEKISAKKFCICWKENKTWGEKNVGKLKASQFFAAEILCDFFCLIKNYDKFRNWEKSG